MTVVDYLVLAVGWRSKDGLLTDRHTTLLVSMKRESKVIFAVSGISLP